MNEFIVKILSIEKLTHDVNRIKITRPNGYSFIPGQATDVSINRPDLNDEKRPFTFTGLSEWNELEFTIKSYDDHNGITKEIGKLKPNDELIIGEPWGAINYKGKGMFFAAGAGVTPFIAILRDLQNKNELAGNKLYFSNKTGNDIILKNEFSGMLGTNFINLLTREKNKDYHYGRIDKPFLKMNINNVTQNFYICGPDEFVQNLTSILSSMGANPDSIVFEK
jgi:ferredoxin-NADP reductase